MCSLAWRADPRSPRRTQTSLAASGDGQNWVLLNCSPDIREQIGAAGSLHPAGEPRGSPISAVALTGADVDCMGGLLSLREQSPFAIYASTAVLELMGQNPMFDVLDGELVARRSLGPGADVDLPGGLRLKSFEVPGKAPLYKEGNGEPALVRSSFSYGFRIGDASGRSFAYVPACAAVDEELRAAIAGTEALFFDGTLWSDDEMIAEGVGRKTGRRMGHMPIWGADGSIAALDHVPCGEKFFVHINNTNPLTCEDSPERKLAEAAGWRIPADGHEITL